MTLFLFTSCSNSEIISASEENISKRSVNNTSEDWKRTVTFIYGRTRVGQKMFIRGGIDWNYARDVLNRDCKQDRMLCAIPIQHNLFSDDPQRLNDHYLDWNGQETGQRENIKGSPLVWTTNNINNGTNVSDNGYGYSPLNEWGKHYWMLDVMMDCSQTVNGWFELKSYISNGSGWEHNIKQPEAPYLSKNHFARCGKINVFQRNKNVVTIKEMPENQNLSDKPEKINNYGNKLGRYVMLENFSNYLGLKKRNVKIYLPADYHSTTKSYRVIYMHDGQNLFEDEEASFGTEWRVDENYDELIEENLIEPAIIVGIWNVGNPDRAIEYTGKVEDKREKYTQWIIHSLKPYIDAHYRTKHQPEFTGIAGSSFGGSISLYQSWNYPEVFGLAAIVSPSLKHGSYNLFRKIEKYTESKKSVRYWIDAGNKEGPQIKVAGRRRYVRHSRRLAEKLASLGWNENDDLAYYEDWEGIHSEKTWSKRIKNILYFLLRKEKPDLINIEAKTYLNSYSIDETEAYAAVELNYENGFKLTKIYNDKQPILDLTSSDENIFTINENGQINPVSTGSASLTITFQGNTDSTDVEINDNFTITYYNTSYKNAYIHYKLGDGKWSKAPGKKMEAVPKKSGWWQKIISNKSKDDYITFSFNDKGSAWDPGWRGNDFRTSHKNIYIKDGIIYTYIDADDDPDFSTRLDN